MSFFDKFRRKERPVVLELDEAFEGNMLGNANKLIHQFEDDFNLDFSVESLHSVDKILEAYRQLDINFEIKFDAILKAGAYVFEVAKQNFGGKYYWYEKMEQPVLVISEPDFELCLFAHEKVKGRIENGIEDNIPYYFEGYMNALKNKSSAIIV